MGKKREILRDVSRFYQVKTELCRHLQWVWLLTPPCQQWLVILLRWLLRVEKAYRTRPHRRHGSASEDQVASVANKQIYLIWLSLSRFPLKMLVDPDVTVLLSRLFQLLITRSEKKWCLKLVDALFFKASVSDLLLFHSCWIQRTYQMRLMIFRVWSYRLRLNLHELFVLQESTVSDNPMFEDMVISLVLETSSLICAESFQLVPCFSQNEVTMLVHNISNEVLE